jgi:hypothetical protein
MVIVMFLQNDDAPEAQGESLSRCIQGSRDLFTALSSGDDSQSDHLYIAESLSLIRVLPLQTQGHTE